jgi:hypothetical protein
MTIDIRARINCSLGPLISGSIGDSYIQGAGLVQTSGTIEINRIITPAIGTTVIFDYTKNGTTRRIPRTLRVLSSFADPIRRITTVQLGCKLTYLKDLKDRLKWTAFNDPINEDLTSEDAEIITIPIYASSIMARCLSELGISASSIPLTNRFSIPEFDFSGGYVSVLNDLLVSESYCGYLNFNEILQVFPLDPVAGNGPVIAEKDIIDLGPIGVGDLPGEAVFVSYSTLRLRNSLPEDETDLEGGGINEIPTIPPRPEPEDPENPTQEEIEQQQQYDSTYNDQIKERAEAKWESFTNIGAQTLAVLKLKDSPPPGNQPRLVFVFYTPSSEGSTIYGFVDGVEKIISQKEISYAVAAADYGNYFVSLDEADLSFVGETSQTVTITDTNYQYSGDTTIVTRTVLESFGKVAGGIGIPFTFPDGSYIASLSNTPVKTEMTITETFSVAGLTRTITKYYKLWNKTLQGQQAAAEARFNFSNANAAASFLNSITEEGLYYVGSESSIRRSSVELLPDRPSTSDLINNQYAEPKPEPKIEEEEEEEEEEIDTNAGDGITYRTEEVSLIEVAVGSAEAQLRIELSMPYTPDDVFIKSFDKYFAIASDAKAKANRYGRTQNRLLLGNRNGMNIQVSAEKLPANPFDPLYVSLNGVTVLYRVNGSQWAFDSNGIACSTDALYWGVAGKSS